MSSVYHYIEVFAYQVWAEMERGKDPVKCLELSCIYR